MNAKMNDGQMKEVLKRRKNFNSVAAIGQFGCPVEGKYVSTRKHGINVQYLYDNRPQPKKSKSGEVFFWPGGQTG